MKRKRDILSNDDNDSDSDSIPQPKRHKKSRFIPSSDDNSVSPVTTKNNTNTTNNFNTQKKKKQSNLSSFFNVPSPPKSKNKPIEMKESASDSDSDSWDEDYFYNNPLKYNCNQIRNKIRKLLTTPGFKITPWLKKLNINSGSYQRYMRLKGKWNNTSNQTYTAAYRYFMKQDKLKQKQKAKDKNKSASQKKKEAVARKKEKAYKEKEVKKILNKIKSVENTYNANGPIYDDCNDVRKNILTFLKRGIMTKTRFLKEIGNVASNSYSSFAGMGPLKLSGASNKTFPKAYHWLEKLRIAEGVKKSKKRLKNELEYPNGFPLRHDNGKRLCFGGQRPVIRGDKVVFF
eukprot:90631_1